MLIGDDTLHMKSSTSLPMPVPRVAGVHTPAKILQESAGAASGRLWHLVVPTRGENVVVLPPPAVHKIFASYVPSRVIFASYNLEGRKRPAYCKRHVVDGTINVRQKRCSQESCTMNHSLNVEGSKIPKYCKKHADDGMVYVHNKRCSHDSCTKSPSFTVEGFRTPKYCKKHADDGMVYVQNKR